MEPRKAAKAVIAAAPEPAPEPETIPLAGEEDDDAFDKLMAQVPSVPALRPMPTQPAPSGRSSGGLPAGLPPGVRVKPQAMTVGETAPEGGTPGLKITGIGLLIHFVGMCGIVLGSLTLMAVGFLNDQSLAWLALVAVIGTLGGFGLAILGPFFYLAAPSAAGRGIIIAAIASYFTALGVGVFGVMSFTSAAAEYSYSSGASGSTAVLLAGGMIILAVVLTLVGHACLLTFYATLADYLDNNKLAENARTLMKILGWSILGSFCAVIPCINMIASPIVAVLQIVLMIGYIVVTGQLAVGCLKR